MRQIDFPPNASLRSSICLHQGKKKRSKNKKKIIITSNNDSSDNNNSKKDLFTSSNGSHNKHQQEKYKGNTKNTEKKNKAGSTATEVACGCAGAIFEVTRLFGQEQCGQRNEIIKKVSVTDGRTKRVVESRARD